jgi:hypothetical protein
VSTLGLPHYRTKWYLFYNTTEETYIKIKIQEVPVTGILKNQRGSFPKIVVSRKPLSSVINLVRLNLYACLFPVASGRLKRNFNVFDHD